MGTGSTFRNGSGSRTGGRFGSSSGSDGYGSHWENGAPVQNKRDLSTVKQNVVGTLLHMKSNQRAYFVSMFTAPLVQGAFEGLFELNHISRNVQIDLTSGALAEFSQKYNILLETPGFLRLWVKSIIARFTITDIRIQSAVSETLDEFVLSALGNDIELYLNGTASEVLSKMDRKMFESASAYFLKYYMSRIIRRELARPAPEIAQYISEACEIVANELVDKYKSLYPNDGYSKLFTKIAETPDWFLTAIGELSYD
ncbi:MAG: hypothetical protein F9K27_12400 [Anaerolineae bacterium]|nr:MAG: hypothetical protein F9K27_12400 [Anaerolineae bacterium]